MEYELDRMMGLDQLDLYFEAHMEGIDGECFNYSVYFEDGCPDAKVEETDRAVTEFAESFDEEDYPGYMDVSKMDDKANIYLDLGNTDPEESDTIIKGILKALNQVAGIKTVIINEGCGFDL